MANSYYTHGSYPATGSSGSSAAMRTELDLISAGFDLLPALASNGGKFVLVNSTGAALTVASTLSESGSVVTASGGLTVTGALTLNGTMTGSALTTYLTSLLASPPAIGGTAAAAGAFTTLSASGTVSGAGFTSLFASPPAIGGTTAAAGAFTTLSASGALSVSGAVSGAGFTSLFASPPAIGGTTAAAGAFTTLSASGTVSGAGFTSLFASPPAIGGTTAAAGSFTTLAVSSTLTLTAGAANQVAFLNASKQLAGSGNLTFDLFWLRMGSGVAGSQNAGISMYASASTAVKMTNTTSGTLVTDGLDLDYTGLDFSIINREAGNVIVQTSGVTALTINSSQASTFVAIRETRVAMAANDVNLTTGNYFTKTISGASTLTVSNVPAAGNAVSFLLDLTNGGSATVTWWSGVKWASGIAPALTASGRDVLGFFTHDGGTTWTGLLLGKDVK